MTVAAYARRRLAEAGEIRTLRGRHSRYYLALAEECAPGLFGSRQSSCLDRLDRLDAERDNFQRALDHAAEQGAAETALRLVNAPNLVSPAARQRAAGGSLGRPGSRHPR